MKPSVDCRGLGYRQIRRRAFLHTTVSAGAAGLPLAHLLAAQAAGGGHTLTKSAAAVIQIWLGGGPTHFETYDPKPFAPIEYRGPFKAIPTNTPGVELSELLPHHAKIVDKLAILRSVYHNSADHDFGTYLCTTGKLTKFQPSTGSYVARIAGSLKPGVPPYLHLGFRQTDNLVFQPDFKASYLGGGFDPFYVTDDPADAAFKVPNLQLADGVTLDRLDDRKHLLARFDHARRDADARGVMESV